MSDAKLTYPGGWAAVIERWEKRRGPLEFPPGTGLPPLDADLAPLIAARVPADPPAPEPPVPSGLRKRHELAREFAGQSELSLLNALVISSLRRRGWPDQAPGLFHRIWTEQAPPLLATLTTRWLVSSVITFADHGTSERQRHIGQSMKMLFKLLKLYEFERLYSGLTPAEPFRLGKKVQAELPMGINPFSIRDGGLDINLLAPIWEQAADEPVMGPLTCHLLEMLNRDPGTVFRRIALMRESLLERDAKRAEKG